ncbi:hypothetical protein OIO90_004442 [Microbotryomycetes sp. JL221]|nr:hypothetical protein OIO90_004442 [Microbotryomycetes sp. JL221]
MVDTTQWHTLTVRVPFPTATQAHMVHNIIQVDPVLRPTELERDVNVDDTRSTLVITLKARTVAQARVALDHCLSDIELVVETMSKFSPIELGGQPPQTQQDKTDKTLEIGLKGQWDGMTK